MSLAFYANNFSGKLPHQAIRGAPKEFKIYVHECTKNNNFKSPPQDN